MPKEQFLTIFQQLKQYLQNYQNHLELKADSAESYTLYISHSPTYNKELFFGAAQIQKSYVSFHLMPVYMYPDLLKDISPELKKRMQGKSCFNFTKIDEALFAELELLTQASFEALKDKGDL